MINPSYSQTEDKTPAYRKMLVGDELEAFRGRQEVPKFPMRVFDIKPDDYLLDFGCGVLRMGLPFVEYLDSRHYYGYDLCDNRITEAKQEVAIYHAQHKLPVLTSDWSDIDRQFKYIWSHQVLIHISDELLPLTISRIKSALQYDGLALMTVNTATEKWPDGGEWLEYPFVVRSLGFYKEQFGRYGMNVELCEDWVASNGQTSIRVKHAS